MAEPLTVAEARSRRVCRLCGGPVRATGPKDWPTLFGRLVWPEGVTLNWGQEFAHTRCLEAAAKAEGRGDR